MAQEHKASATCLMVSEPYAFFPLIRSKRHLEDCFEVVTYCHQPGRGSPFETIPS
jgi:hypothetical protein